MTERNSKIPGHGLGLGRGTLADSQFTPKSDVSQLNLRLISGQFEG